MTLSMEELLKNLVSNHIPPNDQIYSYLCTTDVARVTSWLHRLDRTQQIAVKTKVDKGRKSALVGAIFEHLVRCLFDGCHALSCLNNVRSTTSEIDFLVQVEPLGLAIPFLTGTGTHLLGEAKCVMKGLKKEWIDELRGIMQLHQAKKSLLFTAVPSRKVTREARIAIALHAAQDHLVVPFGRAQINRVINGENFLKLLSSQSLLASNHLSMLEV